MRTWVFFGHSAVCGSNVVIWLLRLVALRGKQVQVTHGLAESLAELKEESPEFKDRVATFLDSLISHYVFDEGKLVVAHAGLPEEMQGRGSGKVTRTYTSLVKIRASGSIAT